MKADFLSGPPMSRMRLNESGYFSKRLDDQQRNAVRFILRRKTVGIFAEQGTGKTWIALGAIEQTVTDDFAGLLIVPKNNKETTWFENAKRLEGITTTDCWEAFKKIKGPRLLIIHFEELRKLITKLIRFGHRWTHIIVDECQRLKARGSGVSRQCNRLRYFGRYRVGLSGTPLESSPIDVWAQMKFINSSVFSDKWDVFSQRYLRPCGWMNKQREFRQSKFPRFIRKLKPWAVRITKESLNLPPMNIIEHNLRRSPQQREVYRSMRSLNYLELPTGERIRAPLTITRDMRLAQIANGFIQSEEGYYWISNVKLRRAVSIIKTSPGPHVLFFRFVPEMIEFERKLKALGYRVKLYYGKTKHKDRVQRGFQDGMIDILLCQARAGGVGIDLYNARTLIVCSVEWSSITFDQLMARVHRRGQMHELDAHMLVMKKTIDEQTHKRIKSKLRKTNRTYYRLIRR